MPKQIINSIVEVEYVETYSNRSGNQFYRFIINNQRYRSWRVFPANLTIEDATEQVKEAEIRESAFM